jgi:hypothetical protein
VRGVHVKLDVLWDYEAPAGAGDTHFAAYRGTNSCIEIRQGAEENYRPELYVKPNRPGRQRSLPRPFRQGSRHSGRSIRAPPPRKGEKRWLSRSRTSFASVMKRISPRWRGCSSPA